MGIWKFMNHFQKRKLFLRFFVSYTLILIIPLSIISFIVYGKLLSTLEEETVNSNITIINQARDTIDMNLTQLDQIAFELSNNPNVYEFTSNREMDIVEANIKLKSIIRELNITSTNAIKSFSDAIAIYSLKNDVIVSNVTKYEPDFFYDTFVRNPAVPYSEWISRVQGAKERQFWPSVQAMGANKSEKKLIMYLQPLTKYGMSNHATLISLLPEDKMWDFFGSGEMDDRSYRAILDKNNQVITTAPGSIEAIPIHYTEIFDSGQDHIFFTYNGKKYIVIPTISSQFGWKYVTILPVSVLMEKISYLHVLFSVALLICSLLGVTLAYIFSVQHYKPIRNTLQWIMTNRKDRTLKQKGDYETILSNMQAMHTDNHMLEGQLHKQLPVLKVHFLLRLLKNNTIDFQEVNELLDFYSIRFPYEQYTVAVLHIEDFSGFVQNHSSTGKSRARFVVCNIGEEMIHSIGGGFALEIEEDKVALLINNDMAAETSGTHPLDQLLQSLKEFLHKKFSIRVSIGVGSSCSSLEMIHQSYNEAIIALNYGSIRGRNLVYYFEQTRINPNHFYYPPEKENHLIVCVKTGDLSSVQSSLDHIYEVNFRERKLSPEMANCLFYGLAGTFFRILEEIQLDYRDIGTGDTDMLQEISQSKDIEAIFLAIRTALGQLCSLIHEKKAKGNDHLRDSCIQYIVEHLSDKELSLNKAADYFHLSPPYLSTFFKQQTGYNFSDYLNRLRIQRAKELLASENEPIQEIANQVGYNSANTFIRIFKKYESVTPGQYKESWRIGRISDIDGEQQ
ncbi:Helix-turn-helix domain-containing protein [Paenibacillus sp. UNCCL117]|uniref:helix-turn-helix domain-containing protein n=1 Tax=unclassified Paenibacillus TaxID=185978 RepID=UPI00087FDC93|nr:MULTISPECIES: helix-turn-helix domain-containing protein [unclassified Paenibacillus]SDD70029.1 Helix-turn-helix domain-containing protein [Paenibacillus sp. cl123]SFW45255.1 Helix-turn-helix domain-containing protein [Paenibacillus sp. UNCCL117]